MSMQMMIGALLATTAMAAFINYRFIRLPNSIGLTLVTLFLSLILMVLGKFGFHYDKPVQLFIRNIDFSRAVMEYMLSFMLFAGSLHLNVSQLYRFRFVIAQLATIGVLISTVLVGFFVFWLSHLLGVQLPWIFCFLFGALISPTDPIAVLGVLKRISAPKNLEIKMAGEALFNDGVSIVLFVTLLNMAVGHQTEASVLSIIKLFAVEVFGGIAWGYALGKFVKFFICQVGSFDVALSLTLALVTGGYALANEVFHVSGALAMAVAGLVIGVACYNGKMPEQVVLQLQRFWELVDELLNAILFVLIGFVMLFMYYDLHLMLTSLLLIPGILLIRFISVLIPFLTIQRFRGFQMSTILMMTWGGLRGGVSIALALSLPGVITHREVLITMTYVVVMFSILVQGLTIGPLIQKLSSKGAD